MQAGKINPEQMKERNLIYPVFLPMQGCPHRCIYCDQNKISGVDTVDIDMEIAKAACFIINHPAQNKEIAFYGGSFTALNAAFRAKLIAQFKAVCDEHTSFRISTHPLYINETILAECASQNIQCIELGIQDFNDEVLSASKRGYDGAQAIAAAEMVKQHGFTLGIQLMPGLPGSSSASITENMKRLQEIKPSFLRLYPVIVIKGTALATDYLEGTYHPMGMDEAVDICADYCVLAAEEHIQVIKVGLPSNLDPQEVLAGPFHPAFGEFVRSELLVRQLVQKNLPLSEIILDKKQQALLIAHNGKYLAVLQQRLKNCLIP